jgi:hypothetical protein
MSDGITEARRGTYFGEKSPPIWQEPHKEIKIKHMPNQKWHKIISFIKSGVRILGYGLIPFNLVAATIVLIFSEIVGIVEELV